MIDDVIDLFCCLSSIHIAPDHKDYFSEFIDVLTIDFFYDFLSLLFPCDKSLFPYSGSTPREFFFQDNHIESMEVQIYRSTHLTKNNYHKFGNSCSCHTPFVVVLCHNRLVAIVLVDTVLGALWKLIDLQASCTSISLLTQLLHDLN